MDRSFQNALDFINRKMSSMAQPDGTVKPECQEEYWEFFNVREQLGGIRYRRREELKHAIDLIHSR